MSYYGPLTYSDHLDYVAKDYANSQRKIYESLPKPLTIDQYDRYERQYDRERRYQQTKNLYKDKSVWSNLKFSNYDNNGTSPKDGLVIGGIIGVIIGLIILSKK